MSATFPRLALALTLLICVSAGSAWAVPIDHPYVPGEVIIKFKSGTSENVKSLVLSDLGATHISGFGRIKSAHKRLGSLTVEQAIAMYENHPNVEFIEPNYILNMNELPDDARFDELWGMYNTGQTGGTPGADISADMAWDVFTGNPNIVVGVIDTGVDYNHVDLVDNIWTNPGEIAGNGIDDDGNGYIDDIHGWNFVNERQRSHGRQRPWFPLLRHHWRHGKQRDRRCRRELGCPDHGREVPRRERIRQHCRCDCRSRVCDDDGPALPGRNPSHQQ